jgi:hypothetical protein
MTLRLRYFLPLIAGVSLLMPLASSAHADQPSPGSGYTWPSHYDFFVPYGGKDGGPVYSKPGYKNASLSLTCKEATGILKMRGYRDITEVSCSGQIYRFEVSRIEGRFVIDIDPRNGDILRRQQL